MRKRCIDPTFQSDVFSLWNALSDYPAARTDHALTHLFRESVRLLSADDSRWCLCLRLGKGPLAERDLCHGWRIRDIVPANPTPELLARIRGFLDGMNKQDPERVGETAMKVLRGGGAFRITTLRRDIANYQQFTETVHYQRYYKPFGVADRMWVACPINDEVESAFIFDRYENTGKGLFGDEEVQRAESLLRGMNWFHRRLVFNRGVNVGQSPCTPAERTTLSLLLTGKSEKEIADELELGIGTVHSRITAIYRKFGVRGRAELMALWL